MRAVVGSLLGGGAPICSTKRTRPAGCARLPQRSAWRSSVPTN